MTPKEVLAFKVRMLRFEVKRWVGTKEGKGDNTGQIVEMFQKAVDGKAQKEAWCMAFIQYCAKKVDEMYDEYVQQSTAHKTWLYPSEHCQTVYNRSPKEALLAEPEVGCVVIFSWWKNGQPTTNGHAEVVTDIEHGQLVTVGGNTSNPEDAFNESTEREGDGVFMKRRKYPDSQQGSLRILGFVKVWKEE